MRMGLRTRLVGTLLTAVIVAGAQAAETPIGKPHIEGGMEVAAVYLQPIEMDPPGMILETSVAEVQSSCG